MNNHQTHSQDGQSEYGVLAFWIGAALIAGVALNCLGIVRAMSGLSFLG